jgi:hypothetical protein
VAEGRDAIRALVAETLEERAIRDSGIGIRKSEESNEESGIEDPG